MKKLFLFLLLCMIVSCGEPIPQVTVEGDNPPSFVISGRTSLLIFEVGYPDESNKFNPHNDIWEIRDTRQVKSKLPFKITYGALPEGHRQVIPKDKEPPPLIEGKKYIYAAQGLYGAKIGCFIIEDGKTKAVECN